LHAELQDAAHRDGHSLNVEILRRLRLGQHQAVMAELAELKAQLRRLLDKT
jgi:hypothetical protein